MDRVKFLKSTIFIVFLALASTKCHSYFVPVLPHPPPPPGPLCVSQFVLVNHACGRILSQPPQESLVTTSSSPSPSPLPLPSSPLPSLSESSPLPPAPQNGSRHGHRHRLEHHGYPESLDEQECCRWMQLVDAECVCPLLVRLPSILLKLKHNYTVVVSESCHVTYQCEGQWNV